MEVMRKIQRMASVFSQEPLGPEIFSMWIEAGQAVEAAKPGQFISIYTNDAAKLLPRPISLCEVDREHGRLRIVYRIAGGGTREFSRYRPGDPIRFLGPLGNGFPLQGVKKALLVGGGIGIPPLLELAKQLDLGCEKQIVLGYRDANLFLKSNFESLADVYVATEDGSVGKKGNVLDVIRERTWDAQAIYACGPIPMLRALKAYASEQKIKCYISLEERMACGIGACLACVCKTKETDEHSHVNKKRVCKDGPVFCAQEVEL